MDDDLRAQRVRWGDRREEAKERESLERGRDEVKWTPQAIPVEACHCPSEDNEFQDKEMRAERCSGRIKVAVGQLTASLLAQENQ